MSTATVRTAPAVPVAVSRAVPPEKVPTILPGWVTPMLSEGGRLNPWITVRQAEPYVPMDANKMYKACNRYLARMNRERKRRHSYLLPADALVARDGELPCEREGRSIVISKRYLLIRLLGYLPRMEPQP